MYLQKIIYFFVKQYKKFAAEKCTGLEQPRADNNRNFRNSYPVHRFLVRKEQRSRRKKSLGPPYLWPSIARVINPI